MKNTCTTFDIIISGGGLTGSLMALSLADLTKADGSLLSIAIVEATDPVQALNKNQTPQPAQAGQMITSAQGNMSPLFDARVLALSHGSAAYLQKMGVWQHLSNDACAIEKIDISDKGHYGKARIEAEEQGVSALGYVVAMALIGKAQLKELASKPNVQWFTPHCIADIHWQVAFDASACQTGSNKKQVEVILDSQQALQADLLLACDGVNSPCRELAGIKVQHNNYQQVAIIANVATQYSHNNKAFERFTEYGPVAMLPLTSLNGEHRCSLVWTMLQEQSDAMLALSDSEFTQQLAHAFGRWLGDITQVGKRYAFPLVLLHVEQQTYHRMALIGNASHTIHPIAGQGFNLGLRDVQQMRELIKQSLHENADIGRFALLHEYSQQRERDQTHIIELTDSLVTLFSNDLLPLVVGRNIGLKVMNYVSPLKKRLVNKLMGY